MAGVNQGKILATYRDGDNRLFVLRATRMMGLFTLHLPTGQQKLVTDDQLRTIITDNSLVAERPA